MHKLIEPVMRLVCIIEVPSSYSMRQAIICIYVAAKDDRAGPGASPPEISMQGMSVSVSRSKNFSWVGQGLAWCYQICGILRFITWV